MRQFLLKLLHDLSGEHEMEWRPTEKYCIQTYVCTICGHEPLEGPRERHDFRKVASDDPCVARYVCQRPECAEVKEKEDHLYAIGRCKRCGQVSSSWNPSYDEPYEEENWLGAEPGQRWG